MLSIIDFRIHSRALWRFNDDALWSSWRSFLLVKLEVNYRAHGRRAGESIRACSMRT